MSEVLEVRILLLEQDDEWRRLLISELEARPGTFVLASREEPPRDDPEEARRGVREFQPHCAVINWGLGTGFGRRMLRALRGEDPVLPILILSGNLPASLADVGADKVLCKGDGLAVITEILTFAQAAAAATTGAAPE